MSNLCDVELVGERMYDFRVMVYDMATRERFQVHIEGFITANLGDLSADQVDELYDLEPGQSIRVAGVTVIRGGA